VWQLAIERIGEEEEEYVFDQDTPFDEPDEKQNDQ
jgi:hypothetical protein